MIKLYPHWDDSNLMLADVSGARHFRMALEALKSIPGSKFVPTIKRWTIPLTSMPAIPPYYQSPAGKEVFCIDTNCIRDYDRVQGKNDALLEIKEKYEFDLGLNGRMKMSLRPYQTVGAKFMYEAKRAINGDTVGLGKTPQALAVTQMMYESGEIGVTLLVIPASLNKKWINEIEKFTHSAYVTFDRNKLLAKNPISKYCKRYKGGYYAIMSYNMATRYSDKIMADIQANPKYKVAMVADEIQYIKNYRSQRAIHLKRIANCCYAAYGLSATYLETSVTNIHSIMEGINPSIFNMSGARFIDRYTESDHWGGTQGYTNGEEIKDLLKPCVIRRHKEDVSDQMPARQEINYWVDLDKEHSRFYNKVLAQVTDEINDGRREGQVQMATALSMIALLRQTCISSELMGDMGDFKNSKLETLLEVLSEMEKGTKVVIFCYFKLGVEMLARELNKRGIKSVGYHGGNCPQKDRLKVIQDFEEDDTVAFVTSDIFREGHDLVAASYLINYDILWNPANMEQRGGRIDRIIQKAKTVFIINILTEGTVERYMFDRMSTYKAMGDDIMDDNRKLARVSMKDINKVLRMRPN